MLIKQGSRLINTSNWQNLVRPERIICDLSSYDAPQYGKFICEPLERGFGTTIGNALRRILMSSLQGCATTSAHIHGIPHEFTTIPGVIEDVTDIILNLKQVRMKMSSDELQRLELYANKIGVVTAAAIKENHRVTVINPEQYIATLSDDVELRIDIEVRMGKGYVPAEMHDNRLNEIGSIPLDASFSPVRKVAYTIEPARVGQMTNYDKLILEVWTDGSITPEDAIAYSAKILKDQLSVFINFDEHISEDEGSYSSFSVDLNENLFKSIDELELSVRANNCLKSANIALVGELVQRTENDMLKTKNFGRKSLDEIRRVLQEMNLDFAMHLDNFERKYQEWLKQKEQNET